MKHVHHSQNRAQNKCLVFLDQWNHLTAFCSSPVVLLPTARHKSNYIFACNQDLVCCFKGAASYPMFSAYYGTDKKTIFAKKK